jgi:hypothetical protein
MILSHAESVSQKLSKPLPQRLSEACWVARSGMSMPPTVGLARTAYRLARHP